MQTDTAVNQRAAERFEVEIPVRMDGGGESATQNLSSTGMLIDAASAPEIGAQVDMTLQYFVDGQDFALRCHGEVVRVQRQGNGYRVAVRLHEPLFTEAELAFLP
jgi:hypothetical protein